jgi:hypothetical protein
MRTWYLQQIFNFKFSFSTERILFSMLASEEMLKK